MTTLSDIVDTQGKCITEEAFKGSILSDWYSSLKWPQQLVISTKQWNLWKDALEAAFTSSGMILKQPLGKWTGRPTQVWQSFYNPRTKRAVTLTAGTMTQFTEYVVLHRTRHHVDATPVAMASQYTDLEELDWNIMIPATVKKTQTRNVIATFHDNAVVTLEDPLNAVTFKDYIKTLPEHIQWLLMHIEFTPGGERTLKHCLKNNMMLKIGTDGSFHMSLEMASFRWLLIGNKNVLVQGAGPVDGLPSVLSSTRAELFGIAAPNEFLLHFMQFHKIESMSKCMKCVDNKAAISRVNQTQHKCSWRHHYSDDVDIITVIVDCMTATTLRHQLWWVKAHQDEKKPYEELDLWGQLNCDANKMAEKFRKLMDDGDVKALKEGFFTDSMDVGIEVDGVKVTSHLLHQIRMHIQGSKHRKYLQGKHKWDDATWNSIEWKGLNSGYLSLGPLK